MSKIKETIYGLLSLGGIAIFFWSALPLLNGTFGVKVIVPMILGIGVSIYALLSLKHPTEDIPWEKDQDDEYKARLETARCYKTSGKGKLRKSVILGAKKEVLEEYDKEYDINNTPGLMFSREQRAKIDRIAFPMAFLFLLCSLYIKLFL